MTKDEQFKFVDTFTKSVVNKVLDQILEEKLPASWEGWELKQHVADVFSERTFPMTGSRKTEYENYKLVNNL